MDDFHFANDATWEDRAVVIFGAEHIERSGALPKGAAERVLVRSELRERRRGLLPFTFNLRPIIQNYVV
jgi:hypothetical protein